MKKCPTCNRTYSDETLSFCLEDGSLLSASFNLREEQETVVIPNNAELPPTQYFSPQKTEYSEIPTIVSAKETNPVFERPAEMQSDNSPNSGAKSVGFLVGKTRRKFSLNTFLIILFILILVASYTSSRIPLLMGLALALVFLALFLFWRSRNRGKIE
jgi:hypothetical protein